MARLSGEDLERRGLWPGSPEWAAEARRVPCRKNLVGRGPTNRGPPKKSVCNVGSRYVNTKKHAESPSRCRIRNASGTSDSRALRREQKHAFLTRTRLHYGRNWRNGQDWVTAVTFSEDIGDAVQWGLSSDAPAVVMWFRPAATHANVGEFAVLGPNCLSLFCSSCCCLLFLLSNPERVQKEREAQG